MEISKSSNKRIAIVADWLIDFGWAELVISHLLEIYPEADIYASVCYMDHPMLEWRRVYTSWLQRVPFFGRHHKLAGILRPWAFRSFDLSGYDIVLCSSSAESKQVAMGRWNKRKQWSVSSDQWASGIGASELQTANCKLQTLVVYCHTPTRYYWSHFEEYKNMMEFWFFNPIARFVLDRLIGWLRKIDYEAGQKVDFFIANSENTRERIEKYYDRESTVIYPGVTEAKLEARNSKLEHTSLDTSHELRVTSYDYYLSLGRCIPYKRFDLLIDAFNLNGKHLILCTATDTPLFRELKKKSRTNIEWKYRVSNEEKDALMANARAFLFPPEEDFGLVPIEAMSHGTPVIAYGKWGALETIVEWETGVFFSRQTPEALNQAIERFEKMEWDRDRIREHAGKFSKGRFQEKIQNFISQNILYDSRN